MPIHTVRSLALAMLTLGAHACAVVTHEPPAVESSQLQRTDDRTHRASWIFEHENAETFVVSAGLAEDAAQLIATSGRPPASNQLPITLTNQTGDTLTISAGSDGRYHYTGTIAVAVEPQPASSCTFCTCMNQGGGASLCESGTTANNCHQITSSSCYSVACIGSGGGHPPLPGDYAANGGTQLLVQAKFHAEL